MPKKQAKAAPARLGRPQKPTDTSTTQGQFAARLRAVREAAGLSVEACAAECDVSEWTWYGWETGRRSPNVGDLVAIMAALECSANDLLPAAKPGKRGKR